MARIPSKWLIQEWIERNGIEPAKKAKDAIHEEYVKEIYKTKQHYYKKIVDYLIEHPKEIINTATIDTSWGGSIDIEPLRINSKTDGYLGPLVENLHTELDRLENEKENKIRSIEDKLNKWINSIYAKLMEGTSIEKLKPFKP